jgi:hypothetical protein
MRCVRLVCAVCLQPLRTGCAQAWLAHAARVVLETSAGQLTVCCYVWRQMK